jgi:uncharacterized protein with ATP-grasp and redox domains
MITALDCYPCFLTQALRTVRMITRDEEKVRAVLKEVCAFLAKVDSDCPPPEIGREVYGIVSARTGVRDPFERIKLSCTRSALDVYPEFKDFVRRAPDPLVAALRLAIAGNVIDFGTTSDFDMQRDVSSVLHHEFAINHSDIFRRALEKTESVLYLGDNAGETVFDRILIEELGKPVVYAVRESPIINDAVREDAVAAGLDGVAEIVSSGCAAPGTIPRLCSEAFRERLRSARFIISKGQGNYEGLSGENLPVYFLLKAKCRVIARDIGVEQGGIILLAPGERPGPEAPRSPAGS